jgi:hypothetical protein
VPFLFALSCLALDWVVVYWAFGVSGKMRLLAVLLHGRHIPSNGPVNWHFSTGGYHRLLGFSGLDVFMADSMDAGCWMLDAGRLAFLVGNLLCSMIE